MAKPSKISHSSMYYFRYVHPAGEGKLNVFDKAPLVIPLDWNRKSMLAVNVHWLPRGTRMKLIQQVLAVAEQRRNGKKLPKLLYSMVKYDPNFRFAMQAIRRYHIGRITNWTEIPPEKWEHALGVTRFRARKAYKAKGYRI